MSWVSDLPATAAAFISSFGSYQKLRNLFNFLTEAKGKIDTLETGSGDAGITSLKTADDGPGLPYTSAANVWARLVLAADKGVYATAAGALALFDLSTFARTLLDDVDAPAMRTTLGISGGTVGAVYGGGFDGAFDLDGTNAYASYFTKSGSTYTQIRDVRATTFVVAAGVTLLPSQYWIYAETSFVNNGTISNNGGDASGATAGLAVSAVGTISVASVAGQPGRTTSGAGVGPTTGSCIGGNGGSGGAGGAQAGGTSVLTALASTVLALGTDWFRVSSRLLNVNTISSANGGNGGSPGGLILNTGTGTSGAGGAGGSGVRVHARSFQNNGTISANGGAGGNAATTGDAAGGGGGGGGGGVVTVMYDTLVTGTGTVTASGGMAGTGMGTGGTNGSAGSAGKVEVITPSGVTIS